MNNQTGFAGLLHPVTQERDAAVFVLFLRERKFSYYSSDAQDKRKLGKSRWIGDLDQPAIRAMRNGGRIVDAVKDTVRSIDDSLEAKIRSEILFKKRAEQAKWALLLASLLGLVALGSAWLWWLHRRRTPWAEKALAAFTEREQSVRIETDQIDTLFTR
ncbi:MAG: hypothetical protein ACK53L_33620, partial [Pirellulaceae bacterium]